MGAAADDHGVTIDRYKELVGEELRDAAGNYPIEIRTPLGAPVWGPGDSPALMILEDGRFKNQLETDTSQGAFAPEVRKGQEKLFFGLPLDTLPENRPIYGYVGSPDAADVGQYGNVVWVLKPEVALRTTVTGIDSLSRPVVPGALRNPGWRATVPPGHVDPAIGSMVQDPLEHGFDGNIDYIEAQVHGGVKLSDVARVDVVGLYPDDPDDHSDFMRFFEAATRNGIPVTGYGTDWTRNAGQPIKWQLE